ncbi:MAG: hypothetical protein JJ863_03425 [Deltaproteobacteria bacterium]|nr:hypothetical protein [Deltaproteobacteria bacterium]
MRVGLNLPWIACGHDFGHRPPPWNGGSAPPKRDWAALGHELGAWRRELGVEVVRFWVLAAGVNYPVGADPRDHFALAPLSPEDALLGRGGRWLRGALVRATWKESQRFVLTSKTLPPLRESFLADFEALFRVAADAGVKLMPSLCSFELFHPVELQGADVFSRGRGALVFGNDGDDAAQIDRFLDATLEPLLDVAARYRDTLEAFEVINEPDWSVEGGPLHGRFHGWSVRIMPKTVSAPMMARFLERGVERITERGLRSTIGFKLANPKWLPRALATRLATLGANGDYVHQVHHYPSLYEPWRLRRHDSLPIQPCIVGEMPTSQAKAFGVGHGWWRERLGDLSRAGDADAFLERRLEICAELGYPMALVWAAKSGDEMTAWGPRERAQVGRFRQRQ